MLALVAAALAAPPVPQLTGRGFAVGVAATAAAAEDPLTDPDCAEGGACAAVRHRAGWGGQLTFQVAPVVLAWVEAASEEVKAPSIEYAGAGFRADGGMELNLRPKHELGALAWVEMDYGNSGTEAAASAHRWGVRAGGGARFGQPDALLTSWLGAELVVTGEDVTSTLSGALDVELQPTVPFNVVGGFEIFSSPLGGPGTSAPLLFLSASGSVGAELGARFALGAAL